jgi:hypothetical protein
MAIDAKQYRRLTIDDERAGAVSQGSFDDQRIAVGPIVAVGA